MAKASRSLWAMRYREARGHAVILACLLWLAAAVIVGAGPGRRDLFGHLKGTDFVHFYTLGRIALHGPVAALYDGSAQHQLQSQWVPESESDSYVPVYPPQTALLFALFAWLPYGAGALAWAAVTATVYALAIRAAWRPTRAALSDVTFVVAAAAGFPPFWSLVLHGQTTTFPLIGFCLGWLALERGRSLLAGLALGLLAIKPQFGLVLAAVTLAAAEWAILVGVIVSVAAQLAAAMVLLGSDVVRAYIETLRQLPQLSKLLEPKPYQLHSIRAVTNLIPWVGTPLWLLLSGLVIWQALKVWRTTAPVRVRYGVMMIASVLVSPHLTIYDATVLALPLIWLGGWIEQEGRSRLAARYWPAVYWLVVTFLIPTALFIRLQVSVLVLAWLFVLVTRDVTAEAAVAGSPTPLAQ